MSSILLGNDNVDCFAKATGDAFGRVWVFYNAFDQGYYGKKSCGIYVSIEISDNRLLQKPSCATIVVAAGLRAV